MFQESDVTGEFGIVDAFDVESLVKGCSNWVKDLTSSYGGDQRGCGEGRKGLGDACTTGISRRGLREKRGVSVGNLSARIWDCVVIGTDSAEGIYSPCS